MKLITSYTTSYSTSYTTSYMQALDLRYIFRGRDYRHLICKFLEPIDKAMLLLALFPYINEREADICNGEPKDVQRLLALSTPNVAEAIAEHNAPRRLRSLQLCIWEWIAACKKESIEFLRLIAMRGHAGIFSMLAAREDICGHEKAIMGAAVMSGNEEMVRVVWELGAYCSHGDQCCVSVAISFGHLELAERLAWGATTHVSIEEYMTTGKLIPADYHAQVLRARNLKRSGRFDLVCKRDKSLHRELASKLLEKQSRGFNVESRINIINSAKKIPKVLKRDIMEYLSAVGNLDALKHIHELDPDEGRNATYYGRAAQNGHLHVIQWVSTVIEIYPFYIAKLAVGRGQINVFGWVIKDHLETLKLDNIVELIILAAGIGYEIYIAVERACTRGVEMHINPVGVLFEALKSGDFRTINHVFREVKCILDEFRIANKDEAGWMVRKLLTIRNKNAYKYANGNVDVIQWINDNLHSPEYDLSSVATAPKKLRVITAKKIVSLGAKVSTDCMYELIKLQDTNLMRYLNSVITDEIRIRLLAQYKRRIGEYKDGSAVAQQRTSQYEWLCDVLKNKK